MNVPDTFKIAYTKKDIEARLQSLSEEVSAWANDSIKRTGQQAMAVCILRGGIFFYTDLLRALKVSVEPAFIRTYSYSSSSNVRNEGSVRVAMGDIAADGRAILLVDDICDTGATLRKLHNVFSELGAASVESSVLIRRRIPNSLFSPTWSAFDYDGVDWFVGYGMEDKNRFCNLESVYSCSCP